MPPEPLTSGLMIFDHAPGGQLNRAGLRINKTFSTKHDPQTQWQRLEISQNASNAGTTYPKLLGKTDGDCRRLLLLPEARAFPTCNPSTQHLVRNTSALFAPTCKVLK